jgi:hypothetical protein
MGFIRRRVHGRDYPVLIGCNDTCNDTCNVDGYVIFPASLSEWKKSDNFGGSSYKRIPRKQAFAYVWKGGAGALAEDWDFEYRETKRLYAWLERFGGFHRGMVLVG